MGTEIERKFLLASDEWKELDAVAVRSIKQAYLINAPSLSARIRIEGSADVLALDHKAVFTVKTGVGPVREEYDFELPLEVAEQSLLFFPSIDKQRTVIPYYGSSELFWEIDQFFTPGFQPALAELELPSLDLEMELPSWIGEEVTWNADHYNVNIATKGYQSGVTDEIEEKYRTFWKPLLERPDGSIDMGQVKKELFDFSNMITNTTRAFSELSGGMISKPLTDWDCVVSENNLYHERLMEEQMEDWRTDILSALDGCTDPEEMIRIIKEY